MQASVCKIIDFPAAHSNAHHPGHCKNIHGHTWTLEVHCKGDVVNDPTRPDFGMVVDFSDIKTAYKEHVEPYVEHQMLNETIDLPEYTTELLASWIFAQLRPHLPALRKVRLWEGKTSYAEFTNGDWVKSQ